MTIKQDRMAERIQSILSQLLLREISDPRLKGVTITEVKLDPELSLADIYVNALGDESRQKPVMQGLDRAKGFLRRELGKHIEIRTTPNLNFHWDVTLERGERLHRLIDTLGVPDAVPVVPVETSEEDDDDSELG